MVEHPFFSIIVVSYNAEKLIKETIDSVLGQTFQDYEIIVKDALSKDSTLRQIPHDSRIKTYSTPDSGIYDGMNQAIQHATGKYLIFLNCGDTFFDSQTLQQIHDYAIKNSSCGFDVIYGNYHTGGMPVLQPRLLTKSYLFRRPLCHQTIFFSGKLFEQYGVYDVQYKILSDYDLTLRLFTHQIPFLHLDCFICYYLGDGFSTKFKDVLEHESNAVKNAFYSKREIKRFTLLSLITFQRFRIWIASKKSPAFLRKIYRYLSNGLNR